MNLDDQKQYKKLDSGRVAESIELLPDQMRQVLDDSRLVKVPKHFSQASSIVVNGMGGSNLGTHIVRSAFAHEIKVPIIIEPGYQVPRHVSKNTIYLLSSYSGTTEEPLSVYPELKKRNAKIMAITEDSPKSKLMKLMLKDNLPGFIFKPRFNPSGQPRLGLGYSIFGQAILLAKAGMFTIKVRFMEDVIASMEIWTRELRPVSPASQNPAKRIALELAGKIPILVASEHLTGNIHVMRNQINECSKHYADYLEIPDLNHYSMEGLSFPKSNPKNLVFLFFESSFNHRRVQKRFTLTKQVVKKNKIKTISHQLKGKDKVTQAFELLQLGTWISYYLGIINQVDPVKIPYVDWFKKQLK